MDYRNLAEEELKLRIAEQFFPTCDCAHRIGKIDFTVAVPVVGTQRDASGAKGVRTRRLIDIMPPCGKGAACSAPTEPRHSIEKGAPSPVGV